MRSSLLRVDRKVAYHTLLVPRSRVIGDEEALVTAGHQGFRQTARAIGPHLVERFGVPQLWVQRRKLAATVDQLDHVLVEDNGFRGAGPRHCLLRSFLKARGG